MNDETGTTPEPPEPDETPAAADDGRTAGDEAAGDRPETGAGEAGGDAPEGAAPDDGGEGAAGGPGARIAALEGEVAGLTDRLLRAAAELENERKRARRDREDAAKFAARKFAEDMLAVADNLSRALDAATGEAREAAAGGLVEGVELTMKELDGALRRHGVEPVEAAGARFDPNLHQAMFEAETADVEPGAVMRVLRTGYTIHGRLLRPAMVGVAKAPAPDRDEPPEA